ncbi:MAG: hypothetical protein ACI9U6_000021 [Loktanella salsilacus]|jgi:hypothetical protein
MFEETLYNSVSMRRFAVSKLDNDRILKCTLMWQRWVRRLRSAVVELAKQMEKQRDALCTERQVVKFVYYYEIQGGRGFRHVSQLCLLPSLGRAC